MKTIKLGQREPVGENPPQSNLDIEPDMLRKTGDHLHDPKNLLFEIEEIIPLG